MNDLKFDRNLEELYFWNLAQFVVCDVEAWTFFCSA